MTTNNEEQPEVTRCPIWPDFPAGGHFFRDEGITEIYSDRAGVTYSVSVEAAGLLSELTRVPRVAQIGRASRRHRILERNRVKLTTWLVDQFLLGNEEPLVTPEIISSVRAKGLLPAWERANRLLRFIATETPELGTVIAFDRHVQPSNARGTRQQATLRAFAWSESNRWLELEFLLAYLVERGWVENLEELGLPTHYYRVTVDGHSEIGRSAIAAVSDQAFVAMWFDESMSDAYKHGIEPAVRQAGYEPIIVNRIEHTGLVNDAIVAEIRKSRFVVADFTHGDDGARGSVYYEAGLAHGRGLTVIFTCRKDKFDDVHFDTRQFTHIVWTDYEDLKNQLKNRIEAAIGRGPKDFPTDETSDEGQSGGEET